MQTDPNNQSTRSNVLILILQLIWLEHSRNPHCSLTFGIYLLLCLEFFFFQEELRVVAGEFFELDKEVSQGQLEAKDVVVVFNQGRDEDLHLLAVKMDRSGKVKIEWEL